MSLFGRYNRRPVSLMVAIVFLTAAIFSLQAHDDGSSIFVLHREAPLVTVINGDDHDNIATIRTWGIPASISFSPDGEFAFIPRIADPAVDILRTDSLRFQKTLTLEPIQTTLFIRQVSFDEDRQSAWIPRPATGRVELVNIWTEQVQGVIITGGSPVKAILAIDYSKAYITFDNRNTVSAVDVITGSELDEVKLAGRATDVWATQGHHRFFVATDSGLIEAIDIKTDRITTTYHVNEPIIDMLELLNSKLLMVAPAKSARLLAFGAEDGDLRFEIEVPVNPGGIASSPDGHQIYVTQPETDQIIIIDIETHRIVKSIAVADWPTQLGVQTSQRPCDM